MPEAASSLSYEGPLLWTLSFCFGPLMTFRSKEMLQNVRWSEDFDNGNEHKFDALDVRRQLADEVNVCGRRQNGDDHDERELHWPDDELPG